MWIFCTIAWWFYIYGLACIWEKEKTKRKEGTKKKLRLSFFKSRGFSIFFPQIFFFHFRFSFFRELSVCHLGFKREIQEDSARGKGGNGGEARSNKSSNWRMWVNMCKGETGFSRDDQKTYFSVGIFLWKCGKSRADELTSKKENLAIINDAV